MLKTAPPRSEKGAERVFVEHGHPELPGLIQLRSRRFSGEEVVSVFRDGAGDLAAVFFDEGFEMVAILRKGAGDDEGFAGEGELWGFGGLGGVELFRSL